ncbi:MAG: hypothetical protein HQL53_12255 [Magnetococcales bacterium]|nr:hypothetical protein [Magnetococcales bacterium]
MKIGPREIHTPFRKIPLEVAEGMTPVEFFNSFANLKNLADENGLLKTDEDFLLYRKAIGHSMEFDCSIILNTSARILDPLGRPVRRDQLNRQQKNVWSRMTQIIYEYMLERYPDPEEALVLCGEASLDPTWPFSKPGVPSIRMIHNHFMVFPTQQIKDAPLADPANPNLTDSGHHGLFQEELTRVYGIFMETLGLEVLKLVPVDQSRIALTDYPRGLPSWEITGGKDALRERRFWDEYDLILKGFLDFYRTFFSLVSTRNSGVPEEAYFKDEIENILLFNNCFHAAAKEVRNHITKDPKFANEIRWRPAYKQLLYRDDKGRLIVTISQNSVGNAITELLGIVVNRKEDEAAYAAAEPALVAKLLDVRDRLLAADLGEPIRTASWPGGVFVPPVKR